MVNKDIAVGQIGNIFSQFQQIDIQSNHSLLDFDLVIIDLNYITAIINRAYPHTINNILVEVDDGKFPILRKRMLEMKEFYLEGRKIVFFLPKPQFYKGRYDAGLTLQITNFVPKPLELQSTQGEKIDIASQTIFTSLFNKYKKIIYYKSCFEKGRHIGLPLGSIKGTDKIIGSFENNLFLLPSLMTNPLGDHKEIDAFGNDLVNLFFTKEESFSLPAWTSDYLLNGEKEILKEKNQLLQKKAEIETLINGADDKLVGMDKLKLLFTATGDLLEKSIASVFKMLGVTILEVDDNRDDIIFEHNGRIAVVEIKGVTKSAAESHAAQLEKWVSEYHLTKNISAKGILIVNAYKDLELSKRTELSFPDQMKKYSEKRDHCLLTATQLLGLYFDCLARPNDKDAIIDKLFDTIGEMKDYKDWTQFLTVTNN